MPYRILIIQKSKEEYFGDYEPIEALTNGLTGVLRNRKHEVSVITSLEGITDEAYKSQDCVIAHPTREKLQRILALQKSYPHVGFILNTGPGQDENDFHELIQDGDGTYSLMNPITREALLSSIKKVVREARKKKI